MTIIKKRTVSLLLALCMMLSFAAPAFAAGAEEKRCAVVRFEDGADADALCDRLETLPGVSVRWTYEALFKGAAIEGTESALAAAAVCGGVEMMYLSRMWSQPYAVGDRAGSSNSLDVIRGEDLPYDGDGMVIAVIDGGLYVAHEAFRDYGIMDTPALSEEDIDAFVADGGTEGRYISQKIPFVYDYSGRDGSVQTPDNHGTHVSALAVGYSQWADGSVKFRGVAPAAQLLGMKVFPNETKLGADDADILKAMEDAYLLGADVVNLSLGTEGDFMEGSAIGDLYKTSIQTMREAGVVICCAAGNSGDALSNKFGETTLPTADYTDYGTSCVPAAYPGTIGVGAVNALTREGGGGIVVNNKVISYVKGVSENEEEVLPDLDNLVSHKLTYVIVGGLGTKEDFEGLDVAGCVAVVRRGEIYFAEKVNNAAQAGAIACVITNNEPGLVLPSVTGTTIPCVVVSQSAGDYLRKQAENGRGTMTVEPDNRLVSTGEPLSMLSASSWGTTMGLRLYPVLSAPGGAVFSAVSGQKDNYGYLSGTSMATPNASGSFAVLMQALNERGVTNRKERADLAEKLLINTAALVTDENGTPLSPRQQGAGVIDLSAALESRAVITDPILEIGDGLKNTIQLSFAVKNLSEEDLRFTVDTRVLTDRFGLLGDRAYNMLSPMDITQYMSISGSKTVTVKAGKEKPVQLTIRVDGALIETLEEAFSNGFFLEGYVTLTEEAGETVHAAFMGYRGNWSAAPVLEPVDFRNVMDAMAEGDGTVETLADALGVNMWYNLVYLKGGTPGNEQQLMLGQNPYENTASNDKRFAISTADSDAHAMAGYGFDIKLYTLRHAAHVIMVVSNRKTGTIYYVDDTANLPRAVWDIQLGTPSASGWFYWDGTDSTGNPVAEGTRVDVEFFAWTESDLTMQRVYSGRKLDAAYPESYRWLIDGSYDSCREWYFPLTVDGTAPTVEVNRNDSENEIVLSVTEEQFLAYALVQDSTGNVLFEESFAGEDRNESYELHVTIPEGEDEAVLYVTLADYASNTIGYRVELSEESGGTTRCAMAFFADVGKNAWYHEAVDFVYETGLMDALDVRTFAPEWGAARAAVVEAIYRMVGEPDAAEVELPFADVQGGEYFADALRWAWREGIVTGYSEEFFAGVAPVSRQQLAVMLYRTARLEEDLGEFDESVLDRFADGAEVSGWAREAMVWAVSEGIFSGDPAGKLNPQESTSRAQLAQILMNILNDN